MRKIYLATLVAASVLVAMSAQPTAAQNPDEQPAVETVAVMPDTVVEPEGVPGSVGDWALVGTVAPGGDAVAVVVTVWDGSTAIASETVGIESDGSFGFQPVLDPADFWSGFAGITYSVMDAFATELSNASYMIDTTEACFDDDPPAPVKAPQPCPLGRAPKNKTEKKLKNFGKTGHTWERHGPDVPDADLVQRAADKNHQIGRWTDYEKALKAIKDAWPTMNVGENVIDIPAGVGEIFLPGGTKTSTGVTKGVVVVNPDGSLLTAYPIDPTKARGASND